MLCRLETRFCDTAVPGQLLKQKKRPFQALSCRGRDVSKTLVFETAQFAYAAAFACGNLTSGMPSGTEGPLEKRWTVTSPEPLVGAAN